MAKMNKKKTITYISGQTKNVKQQRCRRANREKFHKICGGSNECTFLDDVYAHLSQKFNKIGLSHRTAAVSVAENKRCYNVTCIKNMEKRTKKNTGTAWCCSAHLNCTSALRKLHALNFAKLWIAAAESDQHTAATATTIICYSSNRQFFSLKIVCWSSSSSITKK